MRVLRKKGTTSPVWPYHPLLAERSDMEAIVVANNGEAPEAPKPEPATNNAPEPKTKAELIDALEAAGVDVPDGAKKDELQALWAEAQD